MRVLLTDNQLVVRGGLRAFLQRRGNVQICGEAINGREAVDLAIRERPDVVVINVNLPGIDGIEATRQIRRRAAGTEILIFTSENNESVIREALRAGARGYLLQSAPEEQIIQAIEALARHQAFYSSSVSERPGGILTDKIRDVVTTREREILLLISQGHRNKTIALMLGISLKTVDTHRVAAMNKSSNSDRLQKWFATPYAGNSLRRRS
jgi:DNA-binding NarL/FixJ family response regulator